MARQHNATSTLHHYLDRLPRRGRHRVRTVDTSRPSRRRKDPDQLSVDNLGLVVAIARRYWFDGISFDDLIQAGNLGLLRAARSFDAGRGTNSGTWLSFGIRQAILEHLAANQHAVALPRNVHQRLLRPGQGEEALAGRTGRYRAVSLESATPDDRATAARLIPVQPDEAPAAAEAAALAAAVDDLLDSLDDGCRQLIVERFGLDGEPPRGVMAQATARGVSRETIRLRYNNAMATLVEEARSRRLHHWFDCS